MSRHSDRAESELAHEAANWILRAASNRSLITVTRAVLSPRGERVTIYVSIFPENEARVALGFLERGRRDFADYLRTHARIAPLPALEFALDPEFNKPIGGPSGN